MWRSIILNSIYEIIVLCVVHHVGDILLENNSKYLLEEWNEDSGLIFTVLFQIFFYFQICNILLARNIKSYEFNFMKGAWSTTLLIIILMVIIQSAMVIYGGAILKFTPLNMPLHIFTVFVGFTPLLWGTIMKCCVPVKFFKVRIDERPLERIDTVRCIQHYFRHTVHVPSKRPVKQKWRSNSQNQYDTKGKKTITWGDDEELGIKNSEKEEKVNLAVQLRDNFRRQESDFVQSGSS